MLDYAHFSKTNDCFGKWVAPNYLNASFGCITGLVSALGQCSNCLEQLMHSHLARALSCPCALINPHDAHTTGIYILQKHTLCWATHIKIIPLRNQEFSTDSKYSNACAIQQCLQWVLSCTNFGSHCFRRHTCYQIIVDRLSNSNGIITFSLCRDKRFGSKKDWIREIIHHFRKASQNRSHMDLKFQFRFTPCVNECIKDAANLL